MDIKIGTQARKIPLPPIVQSIRQQSKRQLANLLEVLFSNTDDALFELADRSQTDQHQEMYFDSMRVIRLNRKKIADLFLDNFSSGFEEVFQTTPVTQTEQSNGSNPEIDIEEDYALLDQDELEMTVAVSGIVSKVTSLYSLPVMNLTKRLDSLAKAQPISERNNPLGPQALSNSFADSLNELDVGIKIRIILMKLFERFVMEQLGELYELANKALIDAGVLADLKNQSRSPAHSRSQRSTSTTSQANGESGEPTAAHVGTAVSHQGGEGSNAIDFEIVQRLLAAAPGSIGTTGSTTVDSVQLPALPSQELVSVLSKLQVESQQGEIDLSQPAPKADLKALVLAQASAAGNGGKSIARADDDTVNFIGMLFDYILNDRNLAIPMKALIGRLQIPIVKLAILDKSFFSKVTHPARMLLNELSSAGIGWSSAQELKRDALYDKIEAVVLRILNEFTDNPDLFDELLVDLRAFVSKDSKRSILIEQRVKESEAGKARTHSAKLSVQNVINQKACGLRVPSEAGRFISEVWSKVLVLCCVRHGESSKEWQDAITSLDNLLWVLQPLSSSDDIARRSQVLPELDAHIRQEMASIGSTEEDTSTFVDWLNQHVAQLSEDDLAYTEDDEAASSAFENVEVIEEIVLTSSETEEPVEQVAPEFLSCLNQINEGTWVEIKEENSILRCKLATVTQPGNIHVFVNRRGMKVLERNRIQLATLLREEKLKIIDESQVFDRALQNVIGSLRKMQRDRQPD
ncbi:MAG: DUF1631 domain-containing protein [Pseudomonadota bacterium]